MTGRVRRHGVRGMSLVEVAIALAVVGATTAAVVPLWWAAERSGADAATRSALLEARQVLMAFADLNRRLPCPSPDTGGRSSDTCEGQVEGYFPYVSVGAPDARYAQLRYTVSANASARFTSATPPAAFQVFAAPVGAPATEQPYDLRRANLQDVVGGASASLDMCAHLQQAGPDAVVVALEPPAPAVPGASAQMVLTAGEIWSRIRCADQVALDGRGRFNLVLAAKGRVRALKDEQALLDFQRDFQALDVASTTLSVASHGFSAALAALRAHHALMAQEASRPLLNPGIAAAGFVVGSLAEVVADISELVRYANALVFVQNMERVVDERLGAQEALADDLAHRAESAARQGLSLWSDGQ